MQTDYANLTDIASGIADRIRTGAAGRFKLVTHAQATNGAQLWRMLQAVSSIPAAVVTIGTGDFGDDALKRTVRAIVFVIAPFARLQSGEADGVWGLMETVLALFLPSSSAGNCLSYPEVCGIDFSPVSFAPVESEDSICAYCLTLEGTEHLSF